MMSELNKKNLEDMQRLKKRVNKSWLEDGIWEVLWGIWLLLVSSGAFVIYLYKESLVLRIIGAVMIIIGSFTPLLLWKYFRSNYSYPKGGYAVLRNKYTVSSGIAVVMGLLSFFGYMFLDVRYKGVLLGLFLFCVLLAIYFSSGLKRFIIISSIPLLASIISLLFKTPNEIIFNFMVFCPTGIALLFSGLKAFEDFSRRYDEQ
jgi:hypothetical protein